MPSDIVSFAVSTGFGVSVVAGIVSGVCYVIAHSIQRKSYRQKSEHRDWYCDVCNSYLGSIEGVLEGERVVSCSRCNRKVCKQRCSTLDETSKCWICNICTEPSYPWYQAVLSAIRPSKFENSTTMNIDPATEFDENIEAIRKQETEQVRDFIEKLVNSMLGENVDDASVLKLYSDKNYLPIKGQSPTTAHAVLKLLIERLLREQIEVTKSEKINDRQARHLPEEKRNYEDLLATAIINKVVTGIRNNLPSSSAASRLSNSSSQSKEYYFGEETLDSKWRTTDLETDSVSSLEEWIQNDSNAGAKKYVDRLTLTVKQELEEISSESDNEETDVKYFEKNNNLLSDDEPNWFLQKKQFQGTHSPVPVPMLVPNPTTEAKVLIGDKDVEDTSDLSEVASDLDEADTVSGRHGFLIESRTLIGGKNLLLQNGDSGSESSDDSGVKNMEKTDNRAVNDYKYTARADITVDDDNVEDASILSAYSNAEKEAEYTEKYESLPKTIVKTTTAPSGTSRQVNENSVLPINGNDVENQAEEVSKVFEGNYSKREKEKWKNAVEMKNNPYSKENIEKRIQRSSSAVSSLFGPDYYARQASSPSGVKIKSAEPKLSWPPKQEEEIHTAVPAIVSNDDVSNHTNETKNDAMVKIQSYPKTSSTEVETSDSDRSFINFYDVENSQVYKTSNLNEPVTLLKATVTQQFIPKALSEKSDNKVNLSLTSEINKNDNKNSPNPVKIEERFTEKTKTERNFVKQAQPVVKQKTFPTVKPDGSLRRHKSETDLLNDDSFNRVPTVISKKKDNTLISKIYLDPNVRNFALRARDRIPDEQNEFGQQNYKSQLSIDANTFVNIIRSYNSDDGTRRILTNGKRSAYSSEEEIVDVGSSRDEKLRNNNFKTQNLRKSISSEERLLDYNSNSIGKVETPRSLNSFTYNSDSTEDLISKEPQIVGERAKSEFGTAFYKTEHTEKVTESDVEIDEVAKRKVVQNVLGKYSKSQNNLTTIPRSTDSFTDVTVSVKDLKKRFENIDAKSHVVSSLTARSLSKQMRDVLKK